MPERSFDDFDAYAKNYRSIHTENIKFSGADSFYFAEMKVRLQQQYEKNINLKILDIGCGDGSTEIFINKYFPAWHINAIDISQQSISIAKDKSISNCEFQVYDGLHIPFTNENFDIVFMAGVLHHVSFSLHNNLISEIERVLNRKGRLYLFEHNPFNPVTKHLVNTCVFDKDAKLLKSDYTKNLLKKNKLDVVTSKFIIFFPRKGILSKLIFLEKYLQWLPLGGQYFLRAIKS